MRHLEAFDAILPSVLAVTICVGAACSGPAAGTDATGSSAKAMSSATPSSMASTSATATPLPATTNAATVGALEVPEKGSVAYTIELPAGLTNVSSDKLVASYAKSETDEVGPVVRVRPDTGPRVTLDDAIAEAKRAGLEIMKSDKIGAGWLLATLDPNAKVIAVRRLVEGAPGILCNASTKGDAAVAAKERTLQTLEATCRSVAIKRT